MGRQEVRSEGVTPRSGDKKTEGEGLLLAVTLVAEGIRR